VFFGGSGEHIEHRLLVDHSQPHCRSNVIYKGALDGETARSVWVGDVIIRAEAAGTQTYEINRNLLLSEGARADSVPNLEIETGNVSGAGHASATGRFDDEQLFYLQARGIDVETARRLVVRGFFDDVLRTSTLEHANERIVKAIESRLTTAENITEGENE
jgi:Fe-S cluster assembly protein SufD